MTKSFYKVNEMMDGLRQTRDELRVQIHLAGAEAKDEWKELEDKFEGLESKAKAMSTKAEDVSEGALEAIKRVADEVKNGYERIRKHF